MAAKRKNRRSVEKCAVLYLRYSTKNQTDLSLEYQEHECTEYCSSQGYTIVKTFVDAAQTGTTDNRKAFTEMITEAQNEPPWSKIIVYNNSRFARNVEDFCFYRVMLKKLGIVVESTRESNDNSPEARLTRNIGMSFDAYLPEKTAEHTYSSLASLARSCKHCGGIPPLGYDVKNHKLVINVYEAETVKLIFDMYNSGYSYADMITVLNAQGRTTKNGRPFKKSSFNSILQQEKYKGIYVWNRAAAKDCDKIRNNHDSKPLEQQIRVAGGCPAIIDADTFDNVQKRMKDNRRANKSGNGKYHYMLGSMKKIYCAECGALMVGGAFKSHDKPYRYYVCPNHRGECKTKNIRASYLEKHLAMTIVKALLTKDNYPAYNKLMKDLTISKSINGLQKELRSVTRSIENLMRALEKCPTEALMERLQFLTVRQQDLQNRINTAKQAPVITATNLKKLRVQLAYELKDSVDPLIRGILSSIIDRITVSNDGVEIELTI